MNLIMVRFLYLQLLNTIYFLLNISCNIRLLYNRHIFKIKKITNNTIIAEKIGPNNVLKEYEFKKSDYNLLYPIEKVEAYIKNMYEPYIYSFQQILHKSREIKALGDDIINIARSNGIDSIADSNLCDAVSDILSLVEEIGWNTSSLSC